MTLEELQSILELCEEGLRNREQDANDGVEGAQTAYEQGLVDIAVIEKAMIDAKVTTPNFVSVRLNIEYIVPDEPDVVGLAVDAIIDDVTAKRIRERIVIEKAKDATMDDVETQFVEYIRDRLY